MNVINTVDSEGTQKVSINSLVLGVMLMLYDTVRHWQLRLIILSTENIR